MLLFFLFSLCYRGAIAFPWWWLGQWGARKHRCPSVSNGFLFILPPMSIMIVVDCDNYFFFFTSALLNCTASISDIHIFALSIYMMYFQSCQIKRAARIVAKIILATGDVHLWLSSASLFSPRAFAFASLDPLCLCPFWPYCPIGLVRDALSPN